MLKLLARLTEQDVRAQIGRRVEALTNEVFQVLRWVVLLGFVQFLSHDAKSALFDLVYWGLAMLLFGYLASRFLLRDEIPLFRNPDRLWKRLLQSAVNFLICVVAFGLILRGVDQLAAAVAVFRFERPIGVLQ